MKKILFIAALAFNISLIGCGQKDEKNESEAYPNYDTTSAMEHLNMPDSTSPANQNGQGDMKNDLSK